MLNIHAITYGSVVDGPGTRTILHTQGCNLACVGCFNTPTWNRARGEWLSLDVVLDRILAVPCDGVSISGGEPLQQATGIIALLRKLEELLPSNSRNIVLYTGYTLNEIHPDILRQLGGLVDIVVSGRYVQSLSYDEDPNPPPLLGSSNQKIIVMRGRISMDELADIPRITVDIDPEGNIVVQGFPNKNITK